MDNGIARMEKQGELNWGAMEKDIIEKKKNQFRNIKFFLVFCEALRILRTIVPKESNMIIAMTIAIK